jgi:glycosyltransferase involved in cell wall biosynthesis
MRILHCVEFYPPSVGGAQEVVRQISERLASRGHDVTVATTALPERTSSEHEGVRIEGFQVRGNATRGMTGEVDRYRRFVRDGGFDVVMTYAAQQWTTDALLDAAPSIDSRLVLAPCGFSGLYDPAYRDYFARLPAQLANFDALIFHSETYRDIEFAREHGLEGIVVVPNGADEREFGALRAEQGETFRRVHGLDPETPLLLTVGSHTGLKGHATSISALRLLDAREAWLAIAGNTPIGRGCLRNCRVRSAAVKAVTRGHKQVLLTHGPREETLSAFAAADLFVFPSNIEASPIVLYEAAASATPFVTANVGNSAEIASWTGGGEVVESQQLPDGTSTVDPRALAAHVDEMLADPDRRARLGRAGRAAWEQSFSWAAISRRYEAVYARAA